jgi:hypothetical protein
MLVGMTEPTFEPMTDGVAPKDALLEQFTAAPAPLRRKFMRLAERQGFVASTEMTQMRDQAFFGCCVADLRARRRTDPQIKAFASRLASLPNDELDFLVVVCIEMENNGRVTFVPGFTRHIERLLEALGRTLQ